MAKISQETIDRIRDTADILEIVSDYVELRRRGRNFFGLCPFHPEKTPSFSVAPDKQIFHCFGCGIGGNVISFLMEYEKISFVETLENLAQRYGIDIKLYYDDSSKEFFSYLYEIHNLAVEMYKTNLLSASGENVRQYLENRGLTSETLQLFSIGLAGNKWDALYSHIKPKKFPDDVIHQSGLFTKTKKGIFDRFRNRLMFPISNITGRVIAFAGRDLIAENISGQTSTTKDDLRAKYLNSPETPLYNKSNILYGLSLTKDAIRKSRFVIIVEGYTDFLQLFQNNIQNVVATSGTALTEGQVIQIRKFTDTAFLAYDGDAPGRKAAISAGYQLLRGGLTPEIINIPKDWDPDKWVKEKGPKPFQKAIESTTDLIRYHLSNTNLDLSKPANRSQLAREISNEISGLKDEIIQQHVIKQLSEELMVEEDSIIRLVANQSRKQTKKGGKLPAGTDPLFSSSLEKAQMEIIQLLTTADLTVLDVIRPHINLDLFTHPVMKTLVSYLLPKINKQDLSDLSGAVDQFQKKSERDMATKVLFETTAHTESLRVAVDCLITLEKAPLKQNITQQRVRLREMERKGEDASSTLAEVIKLQNQLKELENKRKELLDLS